MTIDNEPKIWFHKYKPEYKYRHELYIDFNTSIFKSSNVSSVSSLNSFNCVKLRYIKVKLVNCFYDYIWVLEDKIDWFLDTYNLRT